MSVPSGAVLVPASGPGSAVRHDVVSVRRDGGDRRDSGAGTRTLRVRLTSSPDAWKDL